ncbi:MAG: hypothetical protein QMC77_07965 [Methanocellales archaeon]|nr:hypothetical protein [Methanocellales archaeon]
MKDLGKKIEAKEASREAKKKGHVAKSELKWKLREALGKASKKA